MMPRSRQLTHIRSKIEPLSGDKISEIHHNNNLFSFIHSMNKLVCFVLQQITGWNLQLLSTFRLFKLTLNKL